MSKENLIKRNFRADKPLQKLLTDGKVTTSKKVTGTNYKFVTVPKKDFQVFVTAYDASGNTVSSKIITVKV